MKRILFLLTFAGAVVLNGPIQAQNTVGILGGFNFAKFDIIHPGPGTEVNSKSFFCFGGLYERQFSQRFSLVLQPQYMKKGTLVKDNSEGSEFPFSLTYLELPVFLKYTFGDKVKPYLLAGPSFGYLLDAEVETDLGVVVFKGDMTEVTEKFDMGIGFGAGLNFPINRVTFFLEGRYLLGLTNAQKGGSFTIGAGSISEIITFEKEEDAFKNRGFQIMAGLAFPLGKSQ